ncbi:hypothetical protein GCM10010385_51780 [Streptomyces geysiriensis]|nr:hypothetical protein GCM10010385_51780 [Streptomyces geysiriensis]
MTAKLPSLSSNTSGQLAPEALPRALGGTPMRRTIFKGYRSFGIWAHNKWEQITGAPGAGGVAGPKCHPVGRRPHAR